MRRVAAVVVIALVTVVSGASVQKGMCFTTIWKGNTCGQTYFIST